MNSGIKLIMYPWNSDKKMRGLTNKQANEIFITDNMPIEDIDIFVKDILSCTYNENLSYDEIFKNTIEDLKTNGLMTDAMLYFYNNDTVITSDDGDSQIDDLYHDIENLLSPEVNYSGIGYDIDAYKKENIIEIVDYNVYECFREFYETDDVTNIDYDDVYEKMKQKYGSSKIIYNKKDFDRQLIYIVETYYNFINKVIRKKLIGMSEKYGNELTDIFYIQSNWKEG